MVMKILRTKLMVPFLIVIVATSVSAQSSGTDDEISKEIQSWLEIDPADHDAMRRAVAKQFLQCAALYNDMSITFADSRPAAAKLLNEFKNFHLIVGQALSTEPGMPLSSVTSLVNAYVETYMLDSLPNFTEAELVRKEEWCNSDSMQNRGKEVVADLEKNLEQVEE